MDRALRHLAGWGIVVTAAVLALGCGANQNSDDSDGLTGHTPKRLATEQKRALRSCALAAAERSYAEQHTGNVTGTLAALRGVLEPPENSEAKFRARRNDWNLDWTGGELDELRVRFGTRGLEISGRAPTPVDATELYRRLETNRELPDLHPRRLAGNDVDGFEFHFVEKTLEDLEERSADLDGIYARAREMGVEPVMRDICPNRRDDSESLREIPSGDWSRIVEDIPGAWRLAGYETSVPTDDSPGAGAVYELAKQKEHWEAVELVLTGEQLLFRLADLVQDPNYSYRPPTQLPSRLAKLAQGRGVQSWAKFDACPRDLCGLDPSEVEAVDPAELKYLTQLIRRLDMRRAQLYDLQAASWVARPVESGVHCAQDLLETNDAVDRLSVGIEGQLRVALPDSAGGDPVRETLRSCSEGSVLEEASAAQRAQQTLIEANLDNSDGLNPKVTDVEPEWAERDFVNGAEQLQFIASNRQTVRVGQTLESLRAKLHDLDEQLMSEQAFLETISESLLAPPFDRTEVSPLPAVELSQDVNYHRVALRAEASRQAVAQFFALLDNLQEDHLIIVERADWNPAADSFEMRTKLGVVSRN